MLLDTSGVLAALVPDQKSHHAAAEVLTAAPGPFVLSPFVLAELDYLLNKLAGTSAALDLLDEVSRGAYRLAEFGPDDVAQARTIIDAHADLGIGLADASIVVLARQLGTRDLLTLDERHFRTLLGPEDKPFRILPADA